MPSRSQERSAEDSIGAKSPPGFFVGSGPQRAAVQLHGVVKRYSDVAAVSDVSLTISEGEFFSLLGPSGCGKTTTLNLIGGFIEPDQGEVVIQERRMAGIPPYRRPVNTVFQNYALFPHMSVAENVAFGLRMKKAPVLEIAAGVKKMLDLMSLSGMDDRRPGQLSGGQQQRVALARALVNQPAVLLLDEPLGSLDLKLRKQMQIELSRIQREVGITFIYVTHDQEEAMTMSDRIAVMDRGRVLQVGSPQEIYEQPASRFVADFIGSSNVLPGRVVREEPGLLWVCLDSGEQVRAPYAGGLPAGTAVSVVVRPDRLEVASTPPTENVNVLRGVISRISYLGTHHQIVLRVGQDREVTAHQRGPVAAETRWPPAAGEEIYAAWPVSRSLCFPE